MKTYCSDEDILELKEYLEKEIAIQEDRSTNDITPPQLDTVSAETTFSEETLQPEATPPCNEEISKREATPPHDEEAPTRETTSSSETRPHLETPSANKYVAPIIIKKTRSCYTAKKQR